MEYADILTKPEQLAGFEELVYDSDSEIVKRTIRVFSSVYHHSVRLLSLKKIEEKVILDAWKSITNIVDSLITLTSTCENEGVLTYLVRFLEASITAHLLYNISEFPEVAQRGREVVKKGLKALKDLVSTPYVGGCVYITAMRSLVTIACLRSDLYEPVTDLLKKQLESLPPTLFDHNVRSLNKMLQRNLFRLLRRAENTAHKKKLVEMMVSVGVPRKSMAPWAPPTIPVKRSPPSYSTDEVLLGRFSPPNKKLCVHPTTTDISSSVTRNSPSNSPSLATQENKSENVRKSPDLFSKKDYGFNFLSSLIPKPSFSVHEAEKIIANKLTMDNVCSIIVSNLDSLPDSLPKDFPKQFAERTLVDINVDVMKERLASLLAQVFTTEQLKSFLPSSPPLLKEKPKEISHRKSPTLQQNTVDSKLPSLITPPLVDTDMRRTANNSSNGLSTDVDMRLQNQKLPKNGTSRTNEKRQDPRLKTKDSTVQNEPKESSMNYRDPRTVNGMQLNSRFGESSSRDPRRRKGKSPTNQEAPQNELNESSVSSGVEARINNNYINSVNVDKHVTDPKPVRDPRMRILPVNQPGLIKGLPMPPLSFVDTRGQPAPHLNFGGPAYRQPSILGDYPLPQAGGGHIYTGRPPILPWPTNFQRPPPLLMSRNLPNPRPDLLPPGVYNNIL